ncbi:MAG: hypothetical protein IPK07_07995 [Deltaproteobacteria bacterium]|nr:hypothetical protein [Deltaproteobacteria bacterium]
MTETAKPLDAAAASRRQRIEVFAAVALSLATVASAWCAYQAKRWSGATTFTMGEANAARNESLKLSDLASRRTNVDVLMFTQFVSATMQGQDQIAKFYRDRFRPETKVALEAWLATNPFEDPTAPPSPFHMKEYSQEATREVERLEGVAKAKVAASKEANERSDQYILLTVMFASVLFLSGISGRFEAAPLRLGVVILALVVLGYGLSSLAGLPIR